MTVFRGRHSGGSRNPGFLGPTGFSKTFLPTSTGIAVIFVLTAIGCKPLPPPKPPLVQTVAILPFDNESNDINAPEIVQSYVYWAIKGSPYQVRDVKETNEFLAGKGVVDGGQLPVMDPVKIAKDLGVQALLYGYISDFGYINIGYYRSRKVGLQLKMVDGTTGQTLWEHSGSGSTANFTADPQEAKNQFAKGFADQLTDKLFKSPLEEEAKKAVINTLYGLPGFQFCGFQNTPVHSNVAKDVIRGQINRK